MSPSGQMTFLALNLKKIQGRIYFQNIMSKDPVLVASHDVPILYNKLCTSTGD